jgi:hypothetical protein
MNTKKRKRTSSTAPPSKKRRTSEQITKVKEIDWANYVSATGTRNFFLNDPLLDWLNLHYSTFTRQKPELSSKVVKALSTRNDKTNNYTEFIMAQGNVFEGKVIEYLYTKFGKECIVDIGGNQNARSLEKADQTKLAMINAVPIIYSGVLHDHETQTYGVPDLLVRSDWLAKLAVLSPILGADEDIGADNLPTLASGVGYHYRVVDIKHTTLHLTADGIGLLNTGSFPAYKGQLWIYTRALGKIQGYQPPSAYILGKRWTFCTKGTVQKGSGCFERMGVIDFCGRDSYVISKTEDAVRWVREVRTQGEGWDITEFPLVRSELYPNMCNQYDHPWHNIKKEFADEIKEITCLWQCGVKNREAAHAVDVFQWTDPECTPDVLGITGKTTKIILDSILKVNRGETGSLISPLLIRNNDQGWQSPQPIEFFVDFEFTNITEASLDPSEDSQLIFMIGVGYFEVSEDLFTGLKNIDWVYKNFMVPSLSAIEEGRICFAFSNYIKDLCEKYGCPNPLMFHWSHAEESQWGGAYNRHRGIENAWIPTKDNTSPRWFDLLKVFKDEPIVIKGSLNFGLKSIARAFHEHGFIDTVWDANSTCVDGVAAMLSTYRCNNEAKARGTTLDSFPQMEDIKKYNEVDCKVMAEIVSYLRSNVI